MSTPFRLLLLAQIIAEMFQQARAELPNECCGLLAGTMEPGPLGRVVQRYPLVNTAASPIKYENAAKDLFSAFRDMRQRGIEHLAIYHSHPTSDPVPSKTDREQNFYGPDIVHLIISMQSGQPTMRGWRLTADSAAEVFWTTD